LGAERALRIAVEASAPQAARDAAAKLLGDVEGELVDTADEADLRLGPSGAIQVYEQILTPVDRFTSVLAGISLEELNSVWSGAATSPNYTTIFPSETAMPALVALLGPPGPAVKPQPAEAVASAVWNDPMSIGIVPFEELTPRLRALYLDGRSVTDNRLDQEQWPLTGKTYLSATGRRGEEALAAAAGRPPISNRDPNKLTVLVMTGVTAMARGTAAAIEREGDYAFPARLVGPEIASADLTLISNEIPFVEGCVPNNTLNNLILCSKPEYFESFAVSGVDAVGLSGNHQNDFGYANMLASLEFYKQKGIPVYAGGADANAARAPIFLEHNGNRIAFLGANQYGPESYWSGTGEPVSAWAGPENPGSARFDLQQMIADIQAVKPQADLVFAEVQHTEFDAAGNYTTAPIPEQVSDFTALLDGGANVVTGVQAHAPQGTELRGDGVILYGLGNLYFDQTWSWDTRTGLVPRHAIYDGKLINTELLVTVIEPDMQLRWATPEERIDVLKRVFEASR
jgi:poly-gamma-glutamate synthesis protein (capsule biosynthesis protein)